MSRGRFGKYGDTKRKERIRQNRLAHLGQPQGGPAENAHRSPRGPSRDACKGPRQEAKERTDDGCRPQEPRQDEPERPDG
jgi:hypothetical protein